MKSMKSNFYSNVIIFVSNWYFIISKNTLYRNSFILRSHVVSGFHPPTINSCLYRTKKTVKKKNEILILQYVLFWKRNVGLTFHSAEFCQRTVLKQTKNSIFGVPESNRCICCWKTVTSFIFGQVEDRFSIE